MAEPDHEAKAAWRSRVRSSRRAIGQTERSELGARIARHVLDLAEVRAARTVAAYVSYAAEPSTQELLDRLLFRGVRVLLPVLLDDLDLDWAEYSGPSSLAESARPGLLHPTSPRLGVDAIGIADVAIVPALAVSEDGVRLGQGGGSYDRALTRASSAEIVALLYDGELLPAGAVQAEPHDCHVAVVVTPSGARRVGAPSL